jgi:phosphinothricin acetyltransferase
VAEEEDSIVGYAYANPWKQQRTAYRFSVEITVYVKQGCVKRGVGSALYTRLFELLRERGIHSVIGGIAQPNDASIALHEKMGLSKVAHFREVGFKHGRWVDVGYWQLTL